MSNSKYCKNRRRFLKHAAMLPPLLALGSKEIIAGVKNQQKPVIKKTIAKSGEKIPVIGMGTSRTFDVHDDEDVTKLLPVLKTFFENGGTLVDSSPMYGNAESVIGKLLAQIKPSPQLFAATKVWIDGEREGMEQMKQSMRRFGVEKFDLMQIHNLRDWKVHLKTLREWKEKGRIRYIGITTSHGRFHEELESILLKEKAFDFVQLSYNIDNREVEKKLLPIAADRGLAVIANRPYQKGSLFKKIKGVALPEWTKDFDCQSWGQFFLKYVVSHPNITCCIPATSKEHHMQDNMGAGFGRLPDQNLRKKMHSLIVNI